MSKRRPCQDTGGATCLKDAPRKSVSIVDLLFLILSHRLKKASPWLLCKKKL